MTKAITEQLLDEISEKFYMYLMNGVKFDSFSNEIDPKLNIDNIDKLLRIHFVLTDDLINFLIELPKRVRRIKTTIEKKPIETRDVRGKIDWVKTIQRRCKINYKDETLFVCSKPEKNFNVTENLILKKLLSIIHSIVFIDLKPKIEDEYSWLDEWTKNENELQKIVKEIFLKNVYINRVEEENFEITDRMISSTLKSRNILYREAAKQLSLYNKLMSHEINQEETKKLLQSTFIKPEKIDVLFEIYWIFKLIECITKNKNPIYHLIEGCCNNIVAEWEDENHLYKIFHNSCGNFIFSEKLTDIKRDFTIDDFISREKEVLEKWQEVSKHLFESIPGDSLWGGRPDIIIEKLNKNTGKIVQVMIGEVKYTDRKDYAMHGLKELLDYMALLKNCDRNYYVEKDKIYNSEERIVGYLFLDKIHLKKENKEKYPSIKIVEFGDNLQDLVNVFNNDVTSRSTS